MALRRALALTVTAVMLVIVGAFTQAAPAAAHHSSGGGGGYPHHYQRIGGQQRTTITFVDHTPARWKVRASVETWNQAPNVDSLYSWQTCPTGAQYCVHVYEVYNSVDRFYGRYMPKPVTYDAFGHVRSGIWVELNRYWAPNVNRDRSTICHELGHVLGLAHVGDGSSCMYGTGDVFPLYPNQHDYDQLSCVYSHERLDGGTVPDPRWCLR
jgi:hypothetical protein